MAVKVAVTKNLVAVKGPQVAVVLGRSGSESLSGSGNPGHQFQYMREYNAESPKQDRKRFNFIVKTINIADLGIIYL